MILRKTPEMVVFGAFANTVGLYFKNNVDVRTRQVGPNVEIRLRDFPLYGKGPMDAVMTVPVGLLEVNRDSVRFRNPLCGASVRFLSGDGSALPHPHVWDNGIPCWNDKSMTNLNGLFASLINTVTWMNVSRDSMTHGGFTICECTAKLTNSPDVWNEVDRHRWMVSRKAGFDVREENPTQFFAQRFPNILSMALRCSE